MTHMTKNTMEEAMVNGYINEMCLFHSRPRKLETSEKLLKMLTLTPVTGFCEIYIFICIKVHASEWRLT